MDYELIICFETHVELNTKSKLFCECPVRYDAPPNMCTCPVCTGQPGALPVLNKKAVEYTVKTGLALNCTINRLSRFARKNYFYPDLPKGYQISQFERPFCENGYLEITGDDGKPYQVGIKRIHLEEDAGKLVHSSDSFDEAEYSLVDYNRSSVPLLEIVMDHEKNPLRSLREAKEYLEKLKQILKYIEVSECMMERGQLRCDVNISIRPKGSAEFGNRSEIKNMSSFRFILEALEYETKRQKEIIESGGEVPQETRLFNEVKKITVPMRSKEDAPDYRYFPDPDLLDVHISGEFIEKTAENMPELPDQKFRLLIEKYDISRNDALTLTREKEISDYFTECALISNDVKKLCNWITKDLFRLLKDSSVGISECPVTPENMSRLVELVSKGKITESIGRTVLEEMFRAGSGPDKIIKEKDLKPISDDSAMEKIVDEIILENPGVMEQIRAGETKPVDFLVGQVMRKTRGKAQAVKVREIIGKKV